MVQQQASATPCRPRLRQQRLSEAPAPAQVLVLVLEGALHPDQDQGPVPEHLANECAVLLGPIHLQTMEVELEVEVEVAVVASACLLRYCLFLQRVSQASRHAVFTVRSCLLMVESGPAERADSVALGTATSPTKESLPS